MPTEKLGIEIEAIARDVAGLRSMVKDLQDIQTSAGGAQTKMADFQRQAEKTRSLRETFQQMNQVGLEMMAVSGGILYGFKKLGMGIIDVAFQSEKYELTLRTILRSAQKAKEELAWAGEFEEITPYSLKDIIASDVVMRSFGLDARKYLGMAGDMAAVYGGDAATLQSVVMGVSHAMASGAAGMDILTRSFGITGDALREFGWKGTKDLVGFRKALEKLLITRYAGGMKDLQKTLPAIIEGFHSEWFKFRRMVGEPLVAKMLPDFSKLYDELVKLRKAGKLDEWAKTIKDLFLGIWQAIKSATTEAWKFLKPIIEFLKKHPEFAKIAGQIAFYGSAFGLATGAALHFTSQVGLTVLGVKALITSMGGLGAINLFTLRTSLAAAHFSLVGILGLVGQIGFAFATGWALGTWLRNLKIGQQTLGQMLDDLVKTKQELKLEEAQKKGIYTETIIKNVKEVKSSFAGYLPTMPMTSPEFSYLKQQTNVKIPNLIIPWESLKDIKALQSYLDKAELMYVDQLKKEKLIKPEINVNPPLTPSPADLGVTQPTDITATTRPEIDNYYYTIHFERDSVQINTLDLSPEKFKRLLIEAMNRQLLSTP